MQEAKTIKIDGFEYTVCQYDPEVSLEVLRVATQTLTMPLLQAISSHKVEDKPMLEQNIGKMLEGVDFVTPLMRLQKGQLWDFVCMTFSSTQAIGNKSKLDLSDPEVCKLHFRGRLMSMFKLIKFSLEVNYKDFLGELLELAGFERTDLTLQST